MLLPFLPFNMSTLYKEVVARWPLEFAFSTDYGDCKSDHHKSIPVPLPVCIYVFPSLRSYQTLVKYTPPYNSSLTLFVPCCYIVQVCF